MCMAGHAPSFVICCHISIYGHYSYRADCRFAPSQWEMSLQSNAVSHWLGANLKSALPGPYCGRWYGIECQCLAYKVIHGCLRSDINPGTRLRIEDRESLTVHHCQRLLSATTKRQHCNGNPGDSIHTDLHIGGRSGRLGHILASIQLCTDMRLQCTLRHRVTWGKTPIGAKRPSRFSRI